MRVGTNVPFVNTQMSSSSKNLEGTCILEPVQSVTQIGYSNKFANANRRHALFAYQG